MDNITLVSPAEYLARFGILHAPDRRPAGGVAGTHQAPAPARPANARVARSSHAGLIVAGAAVTITACSYGASLAWVLWLVRESGAEWMRQLIGEVG